MAFYGKYRAVVKETNDPEKRGRIRVTCPEVLGKQLSKWALPCFPPNTFSVPCKYSLVWLEFEGGRIDSPIWTGVFYTSDDWKTRFDNLTYNPKAILLASDAQIDLIAKNGNTAWLNHSKIAYNGNAISNNHIVVP